MPAAYLAVRGEQREQFNLQHRSRTSTSHHRPCQPATRNQNKPRSERRTRTTKTLQQFKRITRHICVGARRLPWRPACCWGSSPCSPLWSSPCRDTNQTKRSIRARGTHTMKIENESRAESGFWWWVRSIENKKFPMQEHKTSQEHLRDGSNGN
jgi:hypothetical protein